MLACVFQAKGVGEDGLREAVASSGDPVAGIYRSTDCGAALAVMPDGRDGRLLLVALEGATPAVRPGTGIGWMRPAGEAGTYVGELMTRLEGTRPTTPKKFTFKATDGSRLVMVPKKGRLRIRLWKLLPYMFRAPLTIDSRGSETPSEGLLRVWPRSPSSPPPIPRAL